MKRRSPLHSLETVQRQRVDEASELVRQARRVRFEAEQDAEASRRARIESEVTADRIERDEARRLTAGAVTAGELARRAEWRQGAAEELRERRLREAEDRARVETARESEGCRVKDAARAVAKATAVQRRTSALAAAERAASERGEEAHAQETWLHRRRP